MRVGLVINTKGISIRTGRYVRSTHGIRQIIGSLVIITNCRSKAACNDIFYAQSAARITAGFIFMTKSAGITLCRFV